LTGWIDRFWPNLALPWAQRFEVLLFASGPTPDLVYEIASQPVQGRLQGSANRDEGQRYEAEQLQRGPCAGQQTSGPRQAGCSAHGAQQTPIGDQFYEELLTISCVSAECST
jgi:hypothetical protein